MRGTLLNTATVALGAGLGILAGRAVPGEYKAVALHGLGLVTVCLGVKMFLGTRTPLAVGAAVAAGGVAGLALGLHSGVLALAAAAQARLGGHEGFANLVVVAFVLFCVGPLTFLGCLREGLEGRIDLLALKAAMDGISAFFLAASAPSAGAGAGLFVAAALLLAFQGALTLLARPLRGLAADEHALAELTAAGGAILLGTGLGLLELADLHTTNYLPAIALAPLFVLLGRRLRPAAPTVAMGAAGMGEEPA